MKENEWDVGCGSLQEHCTPWKSICKYSDLFFSNLIYIVGDVNKICFWEDLWLEVGSLSTRYLSLYMLCLKKNIPIRWLYSSENGTSGLEGI